MCDVTKQRQMPFTYPSKMRLVGCSQWEFPIPSSKEYWQKICEAVERKRNKVRLPLKQLRNKCNDSNSNSLSSQSSENSLHKVSLEYKSPIEKYNHLAELFASTDSLTEIEKSNRTSRAPKFGIASLQPSFNQTLLDGNETSDNDDVSEKELLSKENQVSSKQAVIVSDDSKKHPKRAKKKHRVKLSVRSAYKALKLLTANKKLDFTPKPIISISGESEFSSGKDAIESFDISDINITDEDKSAESFSLREVQEKLKKSWQESLQSKKTVSESFRLKLDEQTSKTVSTSSRSTSGVSPKFVYPETYESQSKKVLDSIPKLKSTWRKKCDRCLPCIYKSFEPESSKKLSMPKTILNRLLLSSINHGSSFTGVSQKNSTYSLTTSSIEDIDENNFETEATKSVTLIERLRKFNGSNKIAPVIPKDESIIETRMDQTTFNEFQIERNPAYEEQKPVSTLLIKGPEFRGVFRSCREQSKISFTLEEGTSSDEDSQTVLVIEDPSKSKYLAPCHVPTILCPSLEPLRTLRQRQPTTLQARITLLEGTAGNSDDSSGNSDDEIDLKGGSNTNQQFSKRALYTKTANNRKPSGTELESMQSMSLAEAIRFCLEMEEGGSKGGAAILTEVESQREGGEVPFPEHPTEFPFDLALTRNVEILEVLRELPEERLTPMTILETLCKEFSIRVSEYVTGRNASSAKACNKIAIRLAKLLVDSKRYLRPNQFPSDLVFSTYQPPLSNPRQLRRVLPLRSYNLVAPFLRMPCCYPKRRSSSRGIHLKHQSPFSESSSEGSIFSLQVHPPSTRSHISSIDDTHKSHRNKKPSPYALFLKKPRRKAVTWRPLTAKDLHGYDPEATLDMRAKYKMREICKEFCDWFRSLGGKDAGIDEEVLEDMFVIDFDADICRSIQVLIREMPTVPTAVALSRQCLEAGELAMTRKHLIADADAERAPAKVRAFGSTIPWELRHIPPRNAVQKRWLECEHVPRDLETMEVIWKGITHLESVRSFVQWVKDNPQVPMPKALDEIIAMDMTCSRHAEDDEALAQRELDIEQIESFKIR